MPQASALPPLKLSVCITTFNRAGFIGATLESIIGQATEECEIVVVDGASTDDTEQVVSGYIQKFPRLRYVKQDRNNGIDRDYDRAVGLAHGEYCWLMSDDDLLKPGAVSAVLKRLYAGYSLLVVNLEAKNFSMSAVLQKCFLEVESDREYGPQELDRLFVEAGNMLMLIACIVIKREVWLARDRDRYYGSFFIHVGVIFQERLPGKACLLAEPLVSLRMGNTRSFTSQVPEILTSKWPALVRSLALSDSAKTRLSSAEPWRHRQWLLVLRGLGYYSFNEYRRWIRPKLRSLPQSLTALIIALLPGVLVNSFFVLYFSVARVPLRGMRLQQMRQSPFHVRNWRLFARGA